MVFFKKPFTAIQRTIIFYSLCILFRTLATVAAFAILPDSTRPYAWNGRVVVDARQGILLLDTNKKVGNFGGPAFGIPHGFFMHSCGPGARLHSLRRARQMKRGFRFSFSCSWEGTHFGLLFASHFYAFESTDPNLRGCVRCAITDSSTMWSSWCRLDFRP